jgi:hypothetical protein
MLSSAYFPRPGDECSEAHLPAPHQDLRMPAWGAAHARHRHRTSVYRDGSAKETAISPPSSFRFKSDVRQSRARGTPQKWSTG